MYRLRFSDQAEEDLSRLKKNEPQAFKKALRLLDELVDHPTTGTGHPEPLKEDRAGQWSRRINKKHRLTYEVQEEIVLVLVLSAYGHYEDK